MLMFYGLRIRMTDAVFSDHVLVERGVMFCGRKAYRAVISIARAYANRDPARLSPLIDAINLSQLTRKSVVFRSEDLS
jgi:hypothetical protein